MNNKRHPRIVQISTVTISVNNPATEELENGAMLIALDDRGRIWAANLSELYHRPDWGELYPIPPDEPTDERQVKEETEYCPKCHGEGRVYVNEIADAACEECGGTGLAKTATMDPTEQTGLRKELDSLLYHTSRDLHFRAEDLEAAIARVDDDPATALAAVAVDLMRLVSRVCENAREAVEVQK